METPTIVYLIKYGLLTGIILSTVRYWSELSSFIEYIRGGIKARNLCMCDRMAFEQ